VPRSATGVCRVDPPRRPRRIRAARCGGAQAIDSKQLVPKCRTQYYRTAFQIPFDASVRVSLDTNLCMITEKFSESNWCVPHGHSDVP
jgi:hypothetical protein